jgi:hypothetical protein
MWQFTSCQSALVWSWWHATFYLPVKQALCYAEGMWHIIALSSNPCEADGMWHVTSLSSSPWIMVIACDMLPPCQAVLVWCCWYVTCNLPVKQALYYTDGMWHVTSLSSSTCMMLMACDILPPSQAALVWCWWHVTCNRCVKQPTWDADGKWHVASLSSSRLSSMLPAKRTGQTWKLTL